MANDLRATYLRALRAIADAGGTEGWGGTLLLASRHATVLRTGAQEDVQDTAPLHWNGTIVAFALPLPLRPLDLYAYVAG